LDQGNHDHRDREVFTLFNRRHFSFDKVNDRAASLFDILHNYQSKKHIHKQSKMFRTALVGFLALATASADPVRSFVSSRKISLK
jgi:hypothetical protein